MKKGIDYSGVGVVMICHDGAGHLLMHKRGPGARDEIGRWDCGGGGIEFGESPRQAVLRELKEEYGCEGQIDLQLEPYALNRIIDGQPSHWVMMPFVIRVHRSEVRINEPGTMEELGWFRIDALPPNYHPGLDIILANYRPQLDTIFNVKPDYRSIANYFYEAGNLNRTKRSGAILLGTGTTSISEHMYRMMHIVFALAHMVEGVDLNKMLKMVLFHDFSEARMNDLNHLQQKYTQRNEHAAVADYTANLPFGEEIRALLDEYEKRESLESILVKEADNLEWLLILREEHDIGNPRGQTWIPPLVQRLRTEAGKQLAQAIIDTRSDAWWFTPTDEWWVKLGKDKT